MEWSCCTVHLYHKDSFKTELLHTTKDDRSCKWNIYPGNLHYRYACLNGFGEWSARIFCCKDDSIGVVIKHVQRLKWWWNIIKKYVWVWKKRGLIYSSWRNMWPLAARIILAEWLLCILFMAPACLINISRTLFDVLFCLPVIGEWALKINDCILQC